MRRARTSGYVLSLNIGGWGMSIRRLGAQAALLQALFMIATLVVWMGEIPAMGLTDWSNSTKFGQFIVDHKSVLRFAYCFDWFFAGTSFILAAVFTQRFSRRQ